jgi:sigma-B regulation protein RsbU (phosphoserine phosphatase)
VLPHPALFEATDLSHGQVLFRQGDPAEAMYWIESGELAVILELEGGQRSEIRRIGTGQFLGEMALYRPGRRGATAEAIGEVRLRKLTAEALMNLEREQPALAATLHRQVASILTERISYSNLELKQPLARLALALRGWASNHFADSAWDHSAVARAALRDDEVGEVAQAMEFLVHRLHEHIEQLRQATAAREAIESELRIAGQIQLSLLPPPLSEAGRQRVDFAAHIQPAREAGGDLYDAFFLPDGRFFTFIGDVSGKGVPAAVFMALAAMAVRTLASQITDPGELLARVNQLLCERNETMQFVTACAAVFNPESGELAWANAGHPVPAALSPDGAIQWLEGPRAAPLGVFPDIPFPTQRRVLPPGVSMFVYTDGISEAMDRELRLFGTAGLTACLAGHIGQTSAHVVETVLAAVRAHQGDAPQADDITLAVWRRPQA